MKSLVAVFLLSATLGCGEGGQVQPETADALRARAEQPGERGTTFEPDHLGLLGPGPTPDRHKNITRVRHTGGSANRENIMALLRSFALIAAAAFLLTACSRSPVVQLYEGAKQPDSQVLTIRVPSDLEVFTINGSEVDGVNTFFASDYKDVKLTPGRYEILAYYKELWQLDADNHEIVKTNPANFVIEGKGGDQWQLGFNKPQDVEQARAMEDSFSGWVANSKTGERVDAQESGLILNRGFLAPIAGEEVTTATSNSVAPQASAGAAAGATAASAKKSTTVAPEASYLDTLKAQWKQATAEERREFLQWIAE